MPKLFACISHKGGTGRTVTTANMAYHLASLGKNVCILDLDLASPTLGSVVGLKGIATGAPMGIHDVLLGTQQPESVYELSKDVWESQPLRDYRSHLCGSFDIIPGTMGGGDINVLPRGDDAQVRRLNRLIDQLSGNYDFLFCDLRSGISNVANAFLAQPLAAQLTSWLLFHRWTTQHLYGVLELARELNKATQVTTRFSCIRTATIDTKAAPESSQTWINRRNDELERLYIQLQALTDPPLEDLGHVPSELLLQWSECIITEGIAVTDSSRATMRAFRSLAQTLIEQQG